MKKAIQSTKYQRTARRKREDQVGKEQVAELLEMSHSTDPEERLVAAENLCPCHVRCRIPAVWEALYRMMEDVDPRVRRAAWHTIEDGGRPTDESSIELLERLCTAETDPKVKGFAERTLNKVFGERLDKDMAVLWLAGRPAVKQRGKCDFCGATDVFVAYDLETMIPNGDTVRASLICERCAPPA